MSETTYPYVAPTIKDDVWLTAEEKRTLGDAFMHKDLERSALTQDDMLCQPADIDPELQQQAAYIIPFTDPWTGLPIRYPDGERKNQLAMWRKRIDWDEFAPDDKVHRYIQPTKDDLKHNRDLITAPYLPPGYAPFREGFKPRSRTLYIAEGEKKAMSVHKHFEVDCIGITGCWNWRIPGTKRLHSWIRDIARMYDDVVIIPDGDVNLSHIGGPYTALKLALQEELPTRMVELPDRDDKIDDLIADGMTVTEFNDLPECTVFFDNPERLVREYGLPHKRDKDGNITQIIPNELTASTLLRHHPMLARVSMNLDSQTVTFDGVDSRTGAMDVLLAMQGTLGLHQMKLPTVHSAIGQVAWENQSSPRSEWLDSLVWDGTERLAELFLDYCQAESRSDEHTEWLRTLAERWLVNACARQFEPGCQSDYMVITLGAQGVGKSRLVKKLFGDDACITMFRVGDKDTRMMLHRGWCTVFEELAASNHREKEDLKALLTETTDSFRPPYAKEVEMFPRRNVYYGTTNDPEPLQQDESGYRRWCLVEVGNVDVERIEQDRDQLWAEAMVAYRNGDQPNHGWMDVPEVVFEGHVELEPVVQAFKDAWDMRADTQNFETSLFQGSNTLGDHYGGNLTDMKHFIGQSFIGAANSKSFTKELKHYLLANGWKFMKQKKFPNGVTLRNVYVYVDGPNPSS